MVQLLGAVASGLFERTAAVQLLGVVASGLFAQPAAGDAVVAQSAVPAAAKMRT